MNCEHIHCKMYGRQWAIWLIFPLSLMFSCNKRSYNATQKEVIGAEAVDLKLTETQAEEYTKKFSDDPLAERQFGWNLLNQAFGGAVVWDDELVSQNFKSAEYLPSFLAWYSSNEIAEMLAVWAAAKRKETGVDIISKLPLPTEEELIALFGESVQASGRDEFSFTKAVKERLKLRRFKILEDTSLIKADRLSPDVSPRLRGRLVPGRESVLYSPATAKVLFKSLQQLIYKCEQQQYVGADLSLQTASRESVLKRFSRKNGKGFLGSKPCLSEELPMGAAQARVFWTAVGVEQNLPTFPVESLSWSRLASAQSWLSLSSFIKVTEENLKSMLTITLGSDATSSQKFGLVGFHLGVKAPREHFWATYWWTPVVREKRFGDDREITQGTSEYARGVLSHLNMCTATRFNAVQADQYIDSNNLTSWCSNPCIESAPVSHLTNCIGCHQHAGSSVDPVQTFSSADGKSQMFPYWGNSRVTTLHPSDFLWSVSTIRSRILENLQKEGFRL